jgi:quinohemoprotein amine dehydrogenase beta subunit
MNNRFCNGHNRLLVSLMALLLTASVHSTSAAAGEFGVVSSKPNNVYVVNLESFKIHKECTYPGIFSIGVLIMSPDQQVAYVVANGTNTIFGVNIDTCELVFRADQSSGDMRIRSLGSIAISKDGKHLYTVQHRTHLLINRYEVLESHFAVFNTDAGLEAKASRSFPVPRQISGLAEAGSDGLVYLMGPDIYSIDPETGNLETVALSRNWERPLYTPAVGLGIMVNGLLSNELSRNYGTMKFKDEKMDPAEGRILLGITRINLDTAKIEQKEFGEPQSMMFSIISHPTKPNLVYGVANRLLEYDINQTKLVRSKDLPHNFYSVGLSKDGSRIYLSGAMNIIAVYDTETLEPLGQIEISGDMVFSSVQIVSR